MRTSRLILAACGVSVMLGVSVHSPALVCGSSAQPMLPSHLVSAMAIALVDAEPASSQPATQPATQPASRPKTYTSKIPEALLVEEFGINAGEPIDSGFLFIRGKYVDAPYVVTRKGLAVEVNGQVVYRVPLAEREPPSGEIDPKLPPEVNSSTSPYDEVFGDYIREKIAYVQKHHTPEEERKIMANVYAALPFVKKAELEPDGTTLCVTYTNGKTSGLLLATPRRTGKFDGETVLRRAEEKRGRLEGKLLAGGCVFLFNGSELALKKDFARSKLSQMTEILRSARPPDEKFRAMREAGCDLANPADSSSELVTHFFASEQLEKRLAALVKEAPAAEATPRTRPTR